MTKITKNFMMIVTFALLATGLSACGWSSSTRAVSVSVRSS